LVLALSASAARAQTQTFDSLAGAWWFSLVGKDQGAMLVEFTEPVSGAFAVRNIVITNRASFGFSHVLEAFFVISSGQLLTLDSKGQITGTLALTDTDGSSPAGEIVFEGGKPNKKFTSLKLRGTIEGVGGQPLRVNFKGVRVPDTFPVLTGRNTEARLTGKGVKSKVYQLTVRGDIALGLPAYAFTGAGPAEIDKVEETNVLMSGRVMLAPNNRAFGLLEESTDFGTGTVNGKLNLPKSSLVPKVNLKIQADRKVRTYGKLTQPIEPILSVQPTSFNFGAVRLDDTKTQVFQVENIGVGTLSGEASFVSGASPDFSFVGTTSYANLAPGDPPFEITVKFDPSAATERKAQIFFSVDGGAGAKTVQLTGSGGVPQLAVVPATGVFGNVVVAQTRTIPFTISNPGDGVLTGTATVLGLSDFELLITDVGVPTVSISYSIDPGGSKIIFVRFTPTTTGQRVGTLSLNGNVDATVALTGTGTTGTTGGL
jgi:hypothetical protein